MNLYLVKRTDRVGYDQYDAFVVAANSHVEAKKLLTKTYGGSDDLYHQWSDAVKSERIGISRDYGTPTEILGSYNAG